MLAIFRYDCTNIIDILKTFIILEPVYEFIKTSEMSAMGIFTPEFDLLYSNAYIFVIITTYPF